MPLFIKKALVLVKMESSYGVDPTPAGADAFLVKNLRVTPLNAEFANREVIRAYFGASEQLPAGEHSMIEFAVELAGSGTANVAPKWGRIMRASAFSETTLAADVTGTAQAGGARQVTLAAGASAVDNFYNGMVIDITAGTGNGQSNIISTYTGATKIAKVTKSWTTPPDATSQYAIRANVQYRPISSALESVALVCNYDGVQHKALGMRGSIAIGLNAKRIPEIRFRGLGLYQATADVALATPDYSGFRTPLVANSRNTPTLWFHDVSPVVESLEMDPANAVEFRQLIGSESIQVTDRDGKGRVTFEATTVAFKDWWTLSRNGTLDSMALQHGTVAGNKVVLAAPYVQPKPPTYSESQKVLMANMDLVLNPGVGVGNDEMSVLTM